MTRASKPTEASCTFDRVDVQLGNHGRTNIMEPPRSTTIVVEPKILHLCGKYKMAWKKVLSLEVMEDGFMIKSEQHNVVAVGPHMNADWQVCSKLLQKLWNKQQKKRERKSQLEKQEEAAAQKAKRTYGSGNRNRYYSSSWKAKTAKFLARNEGRNDWSSDDEETFNLQRPKRKPLEEEDEDQPNDDTSTTAMDAEEQGVDGASTQGDDEAMNDEHQEQAMEDAAADAELAERQKEQDQGQDDSESEEEQVPKPKRKKFKRKRVRDDDDDSDDDDMFGAGGMTTPNPTSRTVSPNTLAKNRFADDDDEDDDDMPSKAITKSTKTAPIAAFFQPQKKAKATAKKEEEQATPAPPSVKRNATTSSFFAPRSTKAAAHSPALEEMEEDTVAGSQVSTVAASQASTLVPSQTPTVAASQLEDDEEEESSSPMDSTTTPSTPTRKLKFARNPGSSGHKSVEEEDPIVDSPPTSPVRGRTFRRKPMLHRRTYGSAGKSKATRALEMADANQSPKRRNLALALSPGRNRLFKRDYSPVRSPIRNANSPNRLLPMPDFRGIKNIGNTCYMNASLQMLFSVPSFLKQLAKGRIPEHSVVASLVELFQDLQEQQRAPGSARNLKMAVDEKTTKFQGYQQRDANEFLGDLLDTLHDELVDAADGKEEEKENEPPKEETKDMKTVIHPTDNFFRLDVEVCLKCKSCGYSRTKEEMYRYLSLDILQKEGEEVTKPNIEECLHAFFQPEDREIKCEKCEDGQVAEQTMKVLSRPKAILLHLKRFAMVEQPSKEDGGSPTFVLRKNKAPVELNKSLSLDPFWKADETQTAKKQDYEIQSIVHHIGSSADSGHYTADALRDDPKNKGTKTWVSFDDTLVERLSEADVLQDKARRKTSYMMLYTVKS